MTEDEQYMLRCLELAALGAGHVAPNPMVGCVVVHEGRIIGEGYHQRHGEAHAEVNALHSVKDPSLLPHSTIYVNLEPCAHFGKTPPCTDLIIEKGLSKVVIGCLDPFSKVNGQGVARLRAAGIDVRVGVLERESIELNRRFMTIHEKKRPYIILKWAETQDGFVDAVRNSAELKPLKITSNVSDMLHHKWRSEEVAILIGKRTAILDNPSLTARLYAGPNPIRILLDSNLQTPESAKIFNGASRTIMIHHKTSVQTDYSNTEFVEIKDTRNLNEVLAAIHGVGIQSVIVEGGPCLHESFYSAGLWDEIRRFQSTKSLGQGLKALKIKEPASEKIAVGIDQLYIYRKP